LSQARDHPFTTDNYYDPAIPDLQEEAQRGLRLIPVTDDSKERLEEKQDEDRSTELSVRFVLELWVSINLSTSIWGYSERAEKDVGNMNEKDDVVVLGS
jgi:hypothetical protein